MTLRPSSLVVVFLCVACVMSIGRSATAAEVCQEQLREIRAARHTLHALQRSEHRLRAARRSLRRGKLRGRADVSRLQTIARMLPPISGQVRALVTQLDRQERAYIRCVEHSLELGPRVSQTPHQ